MVESQAVQFLPQVNRHRAFAIQTPIAEKSVGMGRQTVHLGAAVHFDSPGGDQYKQKLRTLYCSSSRKNPPACS